jgi:iron complex transport system substrate-binding protein
MRIVSLLPSATEICFALGLGDAVAGVTHECDFPPEARKKQVVVGSRIPHTADSAEIDRAVRDFTSRGESIYRIDGDALREIDPDLIITQDLCHVCAASPGDLASAMAKLVRRPQVLSLNPHSLGDVWNDVLKVGAATGREGAARTLVAELNARAAEVTAAVKPLLQGKARPHVACLEWLDPPYNAGHWVPEMVAMAGGEDVLNRPGIPSVEIRWDQVLNAAPEIVIVMACGWSIDHATEEFSRIKLPEGWSDLPAVKQGRVFVTASNSYFSRPGPRLADGLAILARAIHPELADLNVPPGSIRQLARASAIPA